MNTHIYLKYLVGQIDLLVENQLKTILVNKQLRKLHSNWYEVLLLAQYSSGCTNILIQLYNISWDEIDKDLNTSYDVEQSILYNKVYESHLGTAGGIPFSILLGQFEHNIENKKTVSALSKFSELCATALCPFISNISEEILHKNEYDETADLSSILKYLSINEWDKLRQHQHSSFLFLVGPPLYLFEPNTISAPIFECSIQSSALIVIQLIKSYRILGDFLDLSQEVSPNLLQELPDEGFKDTHYTLQAAYYFIPSDIEKLSELGVSTISQDSSLRTLYISNISAAYSKPAQDGLILEQLMTACHLAHQIKIITQNKIGSLLDETACEKVISRWLTPFTSPTFSPSIRTRRPLKTFHIKINPIPGKVGCYNCNISLEPHMKLESLTAKIILNSEIIVPHLI